MGGLATSSPKRTAASKHGPQQPARMSEYSASEQAYLDRQSIEGGAAEDGTQDEVDLSDHEVDNQLNQSVHEQSEEEDRQLDSSLESLTTVGSTAERQVDQSFGDEESEPEDDPSEGHGQGDESATKSPHENVSGKSNTVAPPLDAPSQLLFIPEELKGRSRLAFLTTFSTGT